MILTYEYRLLPSKSQHRVLESLLESQRVLYNAALEERLGAYRRGVFRTYFDQLKALTEWRASDPEAANIAVNIQRATLRRLDDAYQGFFERRWRGIKAGFPRFRGKGWWDCFGFHEFKGIALYGNRLRFKGMSGTLRVHMHRPLPDPATIRSCVFRRDTKGWKVGLAVSITPVAERNPRRQVGIDLGIATFATLSDGTSIPSLRAARRAERRLRIAQRALARKRRGSNGREKARTQVARCHAHTARVRTNFLHQHSARLVQEYDLIAIDKLNVHGLAMGRIAREVHDASWAKFLSFLRYKAVRAGAQIVEVNPRDTSQDCSRCGMRVAKDLHERRHCCPHCGLSMDRDLNAALNILRRAGVGPGLRNVAVAASVQAETAI